MSLDAGYPVTGDTHEINVESRVATWRTSPGVPCRHSCRHVLSFTPRLNLWPASTPCPHRYDVIFIGGGHNGLAAAARLAGAGLRVLVLERREIVGGAAVTEEIFPGFRVSTAAYLISLLQQKGRRRTRSAHLSATSVDPKDPAFFSLFPDGRTLNDVAGRGEDAQPSWRASPSTMRTSTLPTVGSFRDSPASSNRCCCARRRTFLRARRVM